MGKPHSKTTQQHGRTENRGAKVNHCPCVKQFVLGMGSNNGNQEQPDRKRRHEWQLPKPVPSALLFASYSSQDLQQDRQKVGIMLSHAVQSVPWLFARSKL